MEFVELKKLFEKKYGVIRLADIARELEVSPQVVNNWKSRNQIPYKYVKLIREKLKEDATEPNYINPLTAFSAYTQTEDKSENTIAELISFLKLTYGIIKKEYKIIIMFPTFFLFCGIVYTNFVGQVYTTKAKILPLST